MFTLPQISFMSSTGPRAKYPARLSRARRSSVLHETIWMASPERTRPIDRWSLDEHGWMSGSVPCQQGNAVLTCSKQIERLSCDANQVLVQVNELDTVQTTAKSLHLKHFTRY